jgi:3-dehydroquinate dehydratase I
MSGGGTSAARSTSSLSSANPARRPAKVQTRICTSVGARSPRGLERKASVAFSLGSDLVELRIDRLTVGISALELEAGFAPYAERAIFTVRSRREGGGFRGGEARRLELISRLAELRPAYLDVELATAKENEGWLRSLPKGVETIVSCHDFRGTPTLERLRETSQEALRRGSIAKVVTTAKRAEDCITTLTLCRDDPGKVVSFCMGALGIASRVVSMRMGAPLAYASLPGEAVAPGQLSVTTMNKLRRMVA